MAEEQKTETRRIVRILATDIDGNLPLERALRRIKGVSFMVSRAVCLKTGIDRKKKIGQMKEEDVKSIENAIKSYNLPRWMLNRRKDIETGKDMHIVMSELDIKKRDDINLLKRIHSYKGVRHELGQPVRGQRTRSTFRTQKSVGVAKKKAMPAKAAAPAAPAKK